METSVLQGPESLAQLIGRILRSCSGRGSHTTACHSSRAREEVGSSSPGRLRPHARIFSSTGPSYDNEAIGHMEGLLCALMYLVRENISAPHPPVASGLSTAAGAVPRIVLLLRAGKSEPRSEAQALTALALTSSHPRRSPDPNSSFEFFCGVLLTPAVLAFVAQLPGLPAPIELVDHDETPDPDPPACVRTPSTHVISRESALEEL